MRKMTVVMDDAGRVQVEIFPDPENGRFFTKRDLDRVVRSIKKEYRLSIKEHRKGKSRENVKEQKDVENEQSNREIEDGTEIRAEKPERDSPRTKEQAFTGAAEQALKRSGKLNFRKESSGDGGANSSS